MGFAGKYGPWALVCGASDGTGAEFCRQIAAQGVDIIMVARRAQVLDELAEEIRASTGRRCVTAVIDLAARDATEQVVAAVGGRDVGLFVMNAGSDPNNSRFLDTPIEALMTLVHRNSVETMRLCHHFAAPMRDRGRGGILLVNSAAGLRGSSYMTVYSASKGFVMNLAEGMWAELHKFGVDVLSFQLIMTDTPFLKAMLDRQGMPPLPGTIPSDVAVARALEMLPHGPISHIGQDNHEAGYALVSPDAVRAAILQTDESRRQGFGDL